jgi:choline dehydrogenase
VAPSNPGFCIDVEESDFIVVGAGAAGCVIARRLIEDTQSRVMLVEAGPRYRQAIHNPPLPGMKLSRRYSWGQKSIPQERLKNRNIEWPMGKVIGGSSTVNAMIAYLGHPSNYDMWEALGNPGWSAQALAPYFQKAFGFALRDPFRETHQGTMSLSLPRYQSGFSTAFLEACQQSGMQCEFPLLGFQSQRCGYYPVLQRNGERFESARAYLLPISRHPRLKTQTSAQVLRVLLNHQKAVGIETIEQGVRKKYYATAGVILCAGAFQTPRILQCSGLGPVKVLEAAGIKPILDLPAIGSNFHDHLRMEMVFQTSRVSPGSLRWWIPEALRYLLRRKGVMVSNCCETGAFLCSQATRELPDIQLVTHFQTYGPQGHVGVEICLVAPFSRGRVYLSPEDPYGLPCVDPKFLDDSRDLDAMLAGIDRMREIANQPALRNFRLIKEIRPGDALQRPEDLIDSISQFATTAYHPGGSCAMGPIGALDHNLLVRGTSTLWVADASAIPTMPFGNSTCPVIVLAEKAADLIRQATT